jgi:hypothetical protein
LRYHVMEAADCGWWDNFWRASTLFLAIMAPSGPFVYQKGTGWKRAWIAGASTALLASTILLIWPFGHWASEHTVLAGRWNQIANEWYALYEEHDQLEPAVARSKIAELRRIVVDIENSEPSGRYDPKVMIAAEKAERSYQGFKDAPAPSTDTQASR